MKEMIAVFKTDNNYQNPQFIGITVDINQMLYLCIRKAGLEGITLNVEQMKYLTEHFRSFNYQGTGEFLCIKTKVNGLFNMNPRKSVLDKDPEMGLQF